MINNTILNDVKNKLILAYKPLEIYLFGSYAWGTPDEDSDLDLLIVLDSYVKDHHRHVVDGHLALKNVRISKDILVYSQEDWKKFSKDATRLCFKIKEEGRLLYAKA